MLNEPNHSILQCPACEKALINIGSKVERVHPIPRFLTEHYMKIHAVWILFIPAMLYLQYRDAYGASIKGVGFHGLALLAIPSIVIFFTVRSFPLYRVTDCPYCGYHSEQRLGRSDS